MNKTFSKILIVLLCLSLLVQSSCCGYMIFNAMLKQKYERDKSWIDYKFHVYQSVTHVPSGQKGVILDRYMDTKLVKNKYRNVMWYVVGPDDQTKSNIICMEKDLK